MKIKIQITAEKKKILIIVAVIILAIIIILIARSSKKNDNQLQGAETNEQNIIVVDAPKLAETKKYKNLDISNVKIIVEGSITKISANATNNTSVKTAEEWIDINVLDENNDIIASIAGHIDELEPGETQPIESQILSNGQDRKACNIKITEYKG